MTAEECRKMQEQIINTEISQIQALWEIAAQLAELNEDRKREVTFRAMIGQ